METKTRTGSHSANLMTGPVAALFATLAAMLMLGACALKETDPEDDTAGVVISVKDSSTVSIDFDNDTATSFTDSGTFNLDSLREKMNDKGIDAGTIEITGLIVSYDSTTRNFIAANEGVPFYLRIYIRENDTGANKLALETLVDDDAKTGLKALTFDPDMTFLKLGTDIFGSEAGFQSILNSLKDKSMRKVKVIAQMTVKEKLKVKGALKLNLIVTVAGKV